VTLLVVDVGTSGLRAVIVDDSGSVRHSEYRPNPPSTPAPGLVEFDAGVMASAALEVASIALERCGPVSGVGITNQRASTIVWDRKTGDPVGPGIGWQDLRTVGTCLELQADGIRLAPNESATKAAFLFDQSDPERDRDLCFGTVDSWLAWNLSGGSLHVTDGTNAGVTGLLLGDGSGWDDKVLETLRIRRSALPEIVNSSGVIGVASALPGSPPICGIVGDQQGSLVGQGCTLPGLAKATFGTGGMLDCCVGGRRAFAGHRGEQGTFPIVAWKRSDRIVWGVEAVMLSAGTCVEWLVQDMGIIATADQSEEIAGACETSGDVWFVPAFLGLGTPHWDFGARGTFVGISRGTGKPEFVRAVLEGIAHRGGDLVDAAEADTGLRFATLRVDGGMSSNNLFIQALADAIGRPVEVSRERDATSLGAAYLAGIALGTWVDEDEVAEQWRPGRIVEPSLPDSQRAKRRERWASAVERSLATVPELSSLEF